METNIDFNLSTYLTVKRDSAVIIWLCNLGAEKYWHAQSTGVIDKYEEMVVNRIEEINLLICREQDYLILHEYPEQDFLDYLKGIGFSIPNIITPADNDPLTPISEKVLKDESLRERLKRITREHEDVFFVPYAVTILEERIAEMCGLRMIGAPSQVSAMVNDKIFSKDIAQKLGLPVCDGRVCSNIEELRSEYFRLANEPPYFKKVVIKEPYGASGKGLYLIEEESKLQALLARIKRMNRSRPDVAWLMEGWFERAIDINYQVFISENGQINVFSIKQQILNGTVYLGSKIPIEEDNKYSHVYEKLGMRIGNYLYDLGYRGVASIDSIITQEGLIIPVIEINGRFTLSTYISFLNQVPQNRCIQTRYYKLVTRRPVSYRELCMALDNLGLLYGKENGRGVIIYTAGTLPKQAIDNENIFLGRVFALIIAEKRQTMEEMEKKVEKLIKIYSDQRF